MNTHHQYNNSRGWQNRINNGQQQLSRLSNLKLLLLNHFMAPLGFVWDYPGEPVPER